MFSFFRRGPSGLEQIVSRSIGMLGDARHSFDLATLALLTDIDSAAVDADIRETDERIGQTEYELRRELIVHVSVHGGVDIGTVLGLILLLHKIERVGDQAKNVLDLAEAGVSLAGQADTEEMLAERGVISSLFGEVIDLMTDPDDDRLDDLSRRGLLLVAEHQARIEAYLHSNAPGSEVVPRAVYYRYLKRIVANLLGIVRASSDPLPVAGPVDDAADTTIAD